MYNHPTCISLSDTLPRSPSFGFGLPHHFSAAYAVGPGPSSSGASPVRLPRGGLLVGLLPH